MPTRWRLTLWYTGVLMAILVVFGSMVYLLLNYSLTAEIERNLSTKAEEVLKSTKVVGALPFFLRQVVLPDVEVFAAPDMYIQVVTENGEVAVKSQNLQNYNLPVPKSVLNEVMSGQSSYTTISIDNEALRMFVKPLLLDQDIVGLLQVARPLKPVSLALVRLQKILILGGLAALLLSLWLGWLLSGKALKPIRDITHEARAIGEERDFNRRIKYEGPPDELGELAVTFNKMLGSLEDAYTRLSDSLSMQQRFVADASHELRTPLTSIQGNVDFLLGLDECQKGLREEALSDISSETKRLSRLVKDLLTLARVDSGQNLELSALRLLPVLEETVRQARFLVREQDFTVDLSQVGDLTIEADTDYFKQMLLIFFDNAFKFTPAQKKVVFRVETGENMVVLIFEDEGPGIPAKDIPLLFERFYRVLDSRTGEGTGLGLAIAKWIVDKHNGSIEVQSEYGQGTIFTIYLPVLRLF